MVSKKLVKYPSCQFLVFTADVTNSLRVRHEDGTIWLTQALMAELFDTDVRTVNKHLSSICNSSELTKEATIRNFRVVHQEGSRQVTRSIRRYNPDAIVSVGYRVNSIRTTQFRWQATGILHDFTLYGYLIDHKRIEADEVLGEDYLEQLLQEVHEVRLSEGRFYQKITDIYATAADYDAKAPTTHVFFAAVQSKLHYTVHGRTAAELIAERVDADKPHIGLTSWRNSPDGKVLTGDVAVGKNYLTKSELDDLGRLVKAYLNLAESRAKRHIPTTMEKWAQFLDQMLVLDSHELLANAGEISGQTANRRALEEFFKFRVTQDLACESDFDRFAVQTGRLSEESDQA